MAASVSTGEGRTWVSTSSCFSPPSLSARGRRVYEQVAPLAKRHEERLLAHLTEEERVWLDRIIDKLGLVEAQHLAD